ncbi:MAG TPA: hypothetical protein VIM19_16495, partial [Actinomycetes bacterium]
MDETGPSTPNDRPHDTHHAHEHRSGPSDVGEHPSTATEVATVWDGRYSSEVWPSDPDALLVKFATSTSSGTERGYFSVAYSTRQNSCPSGSAM